MTLLEVFLTFSCVALLVWSFALTHMIVELQDAVAEMLNEKHEPDSALPKSPTSR